MKLYELNQNFSNLMEVLENTEDENLKEIVKNSLSELQLDINSKIENTIKYIKNLEADINAYTDEIKRLQQRKKAMENSVSSLKDYLQYNVKETGVKACGTFKLSIRKSKAINIKDELIIPLEYQKITTTPDKTLIKKAIESGQVVEGAEIIVNESLIIK